MKDDTGSIGTQLSSLGASRGATIQDIVTVTSIKPVSQPSKFANHQANDFRQKLPNISVVASTEQKEAYNLKRMVSNILDYSPQLKVRKEGLEIEKVVPTATQKVEERPSRQKGLRRLGDQLWEISKFLLLLYILTIAMMLQDVFVQHPRINENGMSEALSNLRIERYSDLLPIFETIGFKLAFLLTLLFLNSKLLLSKNVVLLRYKLQKEAGSAANCSSDYLSKFLFRISRLFAIMICRRQMSLRLMIAENCSSQSQEELELILNDQRSDYINQVIQKARVKGNSNSVVTISKPSPFSDQFNSMGGKGALQNIAITSSQNNNSDEDRFSNILNANSSSQQVNKSSGSLNSRVKAQEENIKSYFGLAQKNSLQSSNNANSQQLTPSVQKNGNFGPSHFRNSLQNEAVQDINIEQLSQGTSLPPASYNLQVPNALAKSKFHEQKYSSGQGGYATYMTAHQPYQQISHSIGQQSAGQNQDNFEGLARNTIQYQKQSNNMNGGVNLLPPLSSQQSQNSNFRINQQITIVSPSRSQYIEDRISEKNEDSHSQRHSVTQDSEQDSFFPQDRIDGTPRKEHSREYSIHLNDNLLVNPFAFPMQTEQINLQPTFSIVHHRSPAPKNFKRMQLRDFQKFHSQEHSEGQLQAQIRLANKANLTDSRRSSQLNQRPPFPYVNQASMNSLDIQSQINNRFIKQSSYQTIGTAKSQAVLLPIASQNGLHSANEFTINEFSNLTSRQIQSHNQQNLQTTQGHLDSFRSSKMSSSPTFTNNFNLEGFSQDQPKRQNVEKHDSSKSNGAPVNSNQNNQNLGNHNLLTINHKQLSMKKIHSNALPTIEQKNLMQRSDTSNDLKLANCSEQEAGEREKAFSLEQDIREMNDQEQIQFTLDTYGAFFIFLFTILLVYLRSLYLESNIIFQLCIYRSASYYTSQLIKNQKIVYAQMIFLFCCLQYPDSKGVNKYQFCMHVALSTIYLINFSLVDIRYNSQATKASEKRSSNQGSEDVEEAAQLQISCSKQKIEQIIKSDGHLKNLVQLIPYGIAVLNLEDVSHFNQPFARVLGVRKQRQVLDALNKLQRKVKEESGGNSHTHSQHNQRSSQTHQNNHMTFEKLNQSQKSKKRQQQILHSNLKEDLEYILKNKDLVFAKTQNIFDIYYIEKEEQQYSRQNTSRSPRPKSQMNSVSGAQGSNNHANDQSASNNQARKVYSISISPITWGDKECLLLTVKDITHEKIIDQKQLMDRLKNMIFKSFTHELKTPLNGIIMTVETANFIAKTIINKLRNTNCNGGARVLREKNLEDVANQSKQLHKQLKNMESCSYVLKNIMHDFFDYHQLQTNELTLNVKEFDVSQCLKEIKRIVKYQMKFPDKVVFQHRIEFQNPGGLFLGAESRFDQMRGSVKMICDRDRLMQVLLNLLMNSIKFTTKGFIRLKVHVMQHNNPPIIKFTVKDSGIGIEEERQPYIFNLFEKNESSNLNSIIKSKNKSARMGLPISQNLCMMMGGHITVKSKVGHGSTFKFMLPLNAYEHMTTSRAGADESYRHRSTHHDRQFDSHCTQKTLEFASMLENALKKDNQQSVELDLSRTQLAAGPNENYNNFSHLTKTSGLQIPANGLKNQRGDISPGSKLAKPVKRAKDQDELTDHLSQDDPTQLQHSNTLGAGSVGQGPRGSIYGGSGNLDGNQNLLPHSKKSREQIFEEDEEDMADQDFDEGLDLEDESEEEVDDFDDDDRISGVSGSDSEEEGRQFRQRKSKGKQSSRDLIFESNKKMGQFAFFFNPSSPSNKTHIIQKTHTVYLDEETKQKPRLLHSHSFIESYGEKGQSNGFNSNHSVSKQSSLNRLPNQNQHLILTLGPTNTSSNHPLKSNNNTVTNLSNPLISSNQGGIVQFGNSKQIYNSLNKLGHQDNMQSKNQKVSEITMKNMIMADGAVKQSNSVNSSIPSFVLEPKNQNQCDDKKYHEFLLTSRSSFETENMEEEGVDPRLKLKSPHSKQARDKQSNNQEKLVSFQDAAATSNLLQEETKTPKESLAQAAQRRTEKNQPEGFNVDSERGASYYMKFRDANFSFAKEDVDYYKRISSGGNIARDINFDQLLLGSNKDYSMKLLQFQNQSQPPGKEINQIGSGQNYASSSLTNQDSSQGNAHLKVENKAAYQPQFVSQKNTLSLEDQKLEENQEQKPISLVGVAQRLKHEFSFQFPKKKQNDAFTSGESFNNNKVSKELQDCTDEKHQQVMKANSVQQNSVVNTPQHQSSESSQAYQSYLNQRRTANFNISDVDEQKVISLESGLYIMPQLSRNQSSDLQICNQIAASSSSFLQPQLSEIKKEEPRFSPFREEGKGVEDDEDELIESDPNQFDEGCAIESERDFKDQGLREFATKPAKNQENGASFLANYQEGGQQIINSASRKVQMGSISNFNGFEKKGSMREFIDLPPESKSNIKMDFEKGQIMNFYNKHNQESLMNIGGNFDDVDSCAYSAAANSNRLIQETQNDEQCSMQSSYRSSRRGGGGGGTGRIKGKPSKMNTFGIPSDLQSQKKCSGINLGVSYGDSQKNGEESSKHALLAPENYTQFGLKHYFPVEGRPGARPSPPLEIVQGRARSSTQALSTSKTNNEQESIRKESADVKRQKFFKLDSFQSFAQGPSSHNLLEVTNSKKDLQQLKESQKSLNFSFQPPPGLDSPQSVVNIPPDLSEKEGSLQSQSLSKSSGQLLVKSQINQNKGQSLAPESYKGQDTEMGRSNSGGGYLGDFLTAKLNREFQTPQFQEPESKSSHKDITEVITMKISKREGSSSKPANRGVIPTPKAQEKDASNAEEEDQTNKNIRNYYQGQQRFISFNDPSSSYKTDQKGGLPQTPKYRNQDEAEVSQVQDGNIVLTDMGSMPHVNSSQNLMFVNETRKQSMNSQSKMQIAHLQNNSLSQHFHTAADEVLNQDHYNLQEEQKLQDHLQTQQNQGQSPTSNNRSLLEQEEEEKQQRIEKQKKNDSMYESPKSLEKMRGTLKVRIETQQDQNELFNNQDDGSPHRCPQIMVVDDVQMNRYAIEQMLLLIFGIKVLQAENGQECIDILQKYYKEKTCSCEGIRLILMDLEMPVMDGITAAIRLRRIMNSSSRDPNSIPEIPIVALTAYLDEKENCLRAGMKGFMVKPSSKTELTDILKKYRIRGQVGPI